METPVERGTLMLGREDREVVRVGEGARDEGREDDPDGPESEKCTMVSWDGDL